MTVPNLILSNKKNRVFIERTDIILNIEKKLFSVLYYCYCLFFIVLY